MNRTRHILVLALCAPALALAACGGDSDEDKINELVSTLSENNANFCDTQYVDKKFPESLGGVEACKEAVKDQPQDDSESEISDVKVDGDSATATIKDKDGTNDAKFVKDGDDWKLLSSEEQ